MFFNSYQFVAFFAVVFVLTVLLRNRVRARNTLLLVASYYFYACWDWRFLGLLFLSTVVDFFCGLALDVKEVTHEPPPPTAKRRAIVAVSLLVNLGMLGFFKYYDFFAESMTDLLHLLGVDGEVRSLHILLPVGISFYTFQTLSYTIDLYRGRIATERDFLNFALFVSFFPQLVAGPVERARNLLPQFRLPSIVTWPRLSSGFYLMSWGLFKKVVVADNLAQMVAEVWGMKHPSGVEVYLGCLAFAVQLYCDFSGYSDIARGAARCMGFELMLNFRLPFFAANVTDFWRRWHISFSTWLRDYIYFSLGGSRKGRARSYMALLATMVISGVWHGSGWPFALMGLCYGTQLCAHKALAPTLQRIAPKGAIGSRLWWVLCVFVTFQLFTFPMIFFRSSTMEIVSTMASSAWAKPLPDSWADISENVWILATFSGMLMFIQTYQFVRRDLDAVLTSPLVVRALFYAGMMLGILWFGVSDGEAFVYFQF
ncbi:MAG: MBOAT family O-acyltransferase [Planctomycetota bacterium]